MIRINNYIRNLFKSTTLIRWLQIQCITRLWHSVAHCYPEEYLKRLAYADSIFNAAMALFDTARIDGSTFAQSRVSNCLLVLTDKRNSRGIVAL